jgi:hypothetical protein
MSALRKKKIPFLSGLALSRMVQKGMPVKEDKEEPELEPGKGAKVGPAGKIALAKEKDTDALEAQLVSAKGQIELLKTKLENEKNKAVKPEPNKETGEVPLTVGIAHKLIKDKAYDELDKARARRKIGPGGGGRIEDAEVISVERTSSRLQAPSQTHMAHTQIEGEPLVEFTSQQIKQAYGIANDPRYKGGNYSGAVKAIEKLAKGLSKHKDVMKVLKKTNEDVHAGAKLVYEQIKGLKNKAEKTGMPYGVLKKVYDRGMAAWRGGHRPGTTQQQWAFARVNSFVTKSSGTWGGADKDLAKQVTGKKLK